MSLPLQAVERLFARLSATYGRDFMTKYEGVDPNAVKSSWAHELARFDNDLGSIAWALENLPARAPNVIEFRALCRQAPVQQPERIEHQQAAPARVAAELAKLRPILKARTEPRSNRDWARRIVANAEAGGNVTTLALTMAREALGRREVAEAA